MVESPVLTYAIARIALALPGVVGPARALRSDLDNHFRRLAHVVDHVAVAASDGVRVDPEGYHAVRHQPSLPPARIPAQVAFPSDKHVGAMAEVASENGADLGPDGLLLHVRRPDRVGQHPVRPPVGRLWSRDGSRSHGRIIARG